jgi:hypothetical protein
VNLPSVRFVSIALVAACILAACTNDSDPSAGSSVAITTTTSSVVTTAPPTTTGASTTVASTSTTTIESTTTTTPPPVGWQPIDHLPTLAYPPCCGSNWTGGPPSPAIPSDANAPLLPGLYFASRLSTDTATNAITFEVSRFELCSALPTKACESQPAADDELGVVEPAARGYTLTLDDTVRVGVSGFECAPDQQTATGVELRPLMAAFDESYKQLLGDPFQSGDSPDDLFDALATTPTGGFKSPTCPPEAGTIGSLVWRGDVGPPILLQTQFAYDPQQLKQVAPKSASAEWLRLTAIEIAADGSPTLYFYAGFYS